MDWQEFWHSLEGAASEARSEMVQGFLEERREFEEDHYVEVKELRASGTAITRESKGDLAQEVSAFANADGGLIVWGFEDKTWQPKPIDNLEATVRKLNSLSGECTLPPVPGVRTLAAPLEGEDAGYAVTCVPKSDVTPHQAYMGPKDIKDKYFRRYGDKARAMAHGELDDMFGRRPRPLVVPEVILRAHQGRGGVIFRVQNLGRFVAKWTALRLIVTACPNGANCLTPRPFDHASTVERHEVSPGGVRSVECLIGPSNEVDGILHPGTGRDYASISVSGPDLSRVPDRVDIAWQTMADGMRLREGRCHFTPDDFLRQQTIVLARWEDHPEWGKPRELVSIQPDG